MTNWYDYFSFINKKKQPPITFAFFLFLGVTTLTGQIKSQTELAPRWFQLITPTSAGETKEASIIHNLVVENRFANSEKSLVLHQNKPNPFSNTTLIKFELLTAATVDLTIYDVEGKVIKSYQSDFEKGLNEIVVDGKDLLQQGVLYYQMTTAEQILSKTMIFKPGRR